MCRDHPSRHPVSSGHCPLCSVAAEAVYREMVGVSRKKHGDDGPAVVIRGPYQRSRGSLSGVSRLWLEYMESSSVDYLQVDQVM